MSATTCGDCGNPRVDVPMSVDDGSAHHGSFRPDASGERCLNCGRTYGGHAGTGCFHVPSRIDCCHPPRPDLLVRLQLTIEDVLA